jgi:hypothetical protein
MVDTGESRAVKAVRLRWIARVIFILWALFWLYFNIGSGIVEHEGPESMFWHLAVAAIILVAAAVAWFFEDVGGILLILLALAACYVIRIPAQIATPDGQLLLLTLVLPPLSAGVLLVVNHWVVRRPRA